MTALTYQDILNKRKPNFSLKFIKKSFVKMLINWIIKAIKLKSHTQE